MKIWSPKVKNSSNWPKPNKNRQEGRLGATRKLLKIQVIIYQSWHTGKKNNEQQMEVSKKDKNYPWFYHAIHIF